MTRRFCCSLSLVLAVLLVCQAPTRAAGPSDDLEQDLLQWVFKSAGGVQPFPTPPTTLYFALASADPGDTCANEITVENGYARAQLNPDTNVSTHTNWNDLDQPGTANRVSNKLDITFPTASGGSWNGGSPMQYFFVISSASGAGSCYWSGSITGGGVVVLQGNTLKFTGATSPSVGQLTATVD